MNFSIRVAPGTMDDKVSSTEYKRSNINPLSQGIQEDVARSRKQLTAPQIDNNTKYLGDSKSFSINASSVTTGYIIAQNVFDAFRSDSITSDLNILEGITKTTASAIVGVGGNLLTQSAKRAAKSGAKGILGKVGAFIPGPIDDLIITATIIAVDLGITSIFQEARLEKEIEAATRNRLFKQQLGGIRTQSNF